MKNIKWISFCASNKALKTMLHLFPLSLNSTTPYPISCRLELFGEGENAGSILLDGTRLNQATGVLLDSAFPALNGDYAGFLGVSIEFSLRQQAINFEPSSAIVEFMSYSSSLHYYPSVYREEKISSKSFPVLNDVLTETSLIIVNASQEDFKTDILNIDSECVIKDLKSSKLTIKEYQLDTKKVSDDKKNVFNSCWANGTLDVLKFSDGIPAGVNPYILCRDTTTKKIVSCFAL